MSQTNSNTLDITGALQVIDKASTASFQWLFVVTLALFLGFAFLVFRSLIKQSTELARQAREDSAAMKTILIDMHDKAVVRAEKFAALIAENTEAMRQTRPVLERINATLNRTP